MRCVYQSEPESFWFDHYMKGGAMPAFAGVPYQRGNGIGSIFKSIFRMMAPIAKKLLPGLAGEVLGIGGEIARNVSDGTDWVAPAQRRVKKSAGAMLEQAGKQMQTGGRLGKREGSGAKSIKRSPKRRKLAKRNILEDND